MARSGDGEVFQAKPVLNDQLGEYRYLNSEQIMQQATNSTIKRFTLMTSGFEVESLLPTVRYEDDIQSAESNLSIDMNELINFLDLPSTSNVQDPVIECTDLSKRLDKNSAEENGLCDERFGIGSKEFMEQLMKDQEEDPFLLDTSWVKDLDLEL